MIKNDNIILIKFSLKNDNEKIKMVECIIQNRDGQNSSHSLTHSLTHTGHFFRSVDDARYA